MMTLPPEEPEAGPWRVEPLRNVVRLFERPESLTDRPWIVAIDGRSSAGKTTLAGRVAALLPAATVVHTDDVAWWHSRFGWTDLLVDGVLDPVRAGRPVSYRPPAWEARGRVGSIDVPAGAEVVVVEGVGAGRRDLRGSLDRVVWVQSDVERADARSVARVGTPGGPTGLDAMREWMAEEDAFLARDRPWERADLIVAGTSDLPHDPAEQVVVARVRVR